MTPEAQRAAIAEACPFVMKQGSYELIKVSGRLVYFDPLNDLNAMHEAEKVLTAEQCGHYNNELCEVKRPYNKTLPQSEQWTWGSSAAQRAEAFLKTLNLWTP